MSFPIRLVPWPMWCIFLARFPFPHYPPIIVLATLSFPPSPCPMPQKVVESVKQATDEVCGIHVHVVCITYVCVYMCVCHVCVCMDVYVWHVCVACECVVAICVSMLCCVCVICVCMLCVWQVCACVCVWMCMCVMWMCNICVCMLGMWLSCVCACCYMAWCVCVAGMYGMCVFNTSERFITTPLNTSLHLHGPHTHVIPYLYQF